jgi:hypothetical protein
MYDNSRPLWPGREDVLHRHGADGSDLYAGAQEMIQEAVLKSGQAVSHSGQQLCSVPDEYPPHVTWIADIRDMIAIMLNGSRCNTN